MKDFDTIPRDRSMEEHENSSSTATEKPIFVTKRISVHHMSSEQVEERKIYYINVLEHPGLYIYTEVATKRTESC